MQTAQKKNISRLPPVSQSNLLSKAPDCRVQRLLVMKKQPVEQFTKLLPLFLHFMSYQLMFWLSNLCFLCVLFVVVIVVFNILLAFSDFLPTC